MNFQHIIKERRSVRNYNAVDVDHQVIQRILEEAVWAPSAGNSQPWKIKVLTRPAVEELLDNFENETLEFLYPTYRQKLLEHLEEKSPHRLKAADIDQLASDTIGKHLKISGRPSHIIAVYYEKPRYMIILKQTIPALWYRFRSKRGRNTITYLVRMANSFFKSVKNYKWVTTASLSNFIYAVTLSAFEKGVGSCILFSFNLHPKVKKYLKLKEREDLFGLVALGEPCKQENAVGGDAVVVADRKRIQMEDVLFRPGAG